MSVHSEERRWICDYKSCKKAYKHKIDLRHHRTTDHEDLNGQNGSGRPNPQFACEYVQNCFFPKALLKDISHHIVRNADGFANMKVAKGDTNTREL